MSKQLSDLIKKHTAQVGVIGLGYVGLPLAIEFCEKGFNVAGFDISPAKVKLINSGKSDIGDVSNAQVKTAVEAGTLVASEDFAGLKKCDVCTICVPTPLSKTKDPDVSYILAAFKQVQKYLHKDMLIILESTTYPGTTEELIQPLLEEGGLKAGRDFFLSFSPERVDPGNAKFGIRNTPRVVGGSTKKCAEMAALFYGQIINHVHPVSSTKAAEMVKLLENTFRSVNIGLVNEVALMCDRLGIDAWEIIDAASSKPFGFMPFWPGPGLGGHCIPIDPHYLSWKLKSLNYYSRFIELAGDINSHMPEYVLERIGRLLNSKSKAIRGSKVVVLGVAYKRDISDVRESPALDCMRLLSEHGAKVSYNDPFVPSIDMAGSRWKSQPLTKQLIESADLVVILTDHTQYDYQWLADNAKLIFDSRNATKSVKGRKSHIDRL
ncbi:MAG: nucleotide sugar dehydrogenase [bacterium]